jgi:tRNA G18 (ribose-2'-O)-methylase SpoU
VKSRAGNENELDVVVRGYFGIGVEGISKPMNVGNLFRSAHAFGASFVFTINAHYKVREARSDTARSHTHMPYYEWDSFDDLTMPRGCSLVGVELEDEAIDLPSFRHPLQAAYFLGPEKGSLSPEFLEKCDHIIKIPTSFCVNVATAGAIVLYDRVISLGRFPIRPEHGGGPTQAPPPQDAWRKPPGRRPPD